MLEHKMVPPSSGFEIDLPTGFTTYKALLVDVLRSLGAYIAKLGKCVDNCTENDVKEKQNTNGVEEKVPPYSWVIVFVVYFRHADCLADSAAHANSESEGTYEALP